MSRMAGTFSAAHLRSSGRPFITSSTTGVPVSTTARRRSSWRPGSSSEDRDAASPIMFCHSPSTTTATSAARAASTARCSSAASSKSAGSSGAFPPNMSNIDGNTRCAGRTPGTYCTSTRVPDPAPDPFQHGDRLGEVEVEAPRPEVSRRESASGPMHRDRRRRRVVQRQQPALVAEQHRRSLGGGPGDLSVGLVAEHVTGALHVDERVLEEARGESSPRAPERHWHPAPRWPASPASRASGMWA